MVVEVREAGPGDVPAMLGFIRELAAYEREPEAVVATEADLLRDGFGLAADGRTPLGSPVRWRALMAEVAGEVAGFALYFWSYSTWLGHHGIRLEDVYVTPAKRGLGVGRALLRRLAAIAVEEGCERLEWDVLAWNAPAIGFYEEMGAREQSEWRIMRVSGEALRELAGTRASSC